MKNQYSDFKNRASDLVVYTLYLKHIAEVGTYNDQGQYSLKSKLCTHKAFPSIIKERQDIYN